MIKALIFDWGDTVMRDFSDQPGPMADWEKVEWIPGAEAALKTLSKEYFCAIATNASMSDTELMRKALRRIDAEKYFRFFISSKDIGFEKPDLMFFRSIAALIGNNTNECIHIGNLYEKDIRGAKAAGMFTILFNEKKLQGSFPDADVVIKNMEQLPAAIKSFS
jgi:HAD superfamily hydrolase (TIGR01509 family)